MLRSGLWSFVCSMLLDRLWLCPRLYFKLYNRICSRFHSRLRFRLCSILCSRLCQRPFLWFSPAFSYRASPQKMQHKDSLCCSFFGTPCRLHPIPIICTFLQHFWTFIKAVTNVLQKQKTMASYTLQTPPRVAHAKPGQLFAFEVYVPTFVIYGI